MSKRLCVPLLVLIAGLFGCDEETTTDAGSTDAGGRIDSGGPVDSGLQDAGSTDTGAADAASDAGSDAGDPSVLSFGPLVCDHTRFGPSVAVGQNIECTFDVRGTAGRTVDFTCADSGGAAVVCDCTGGIQVQPCFTGERTIPFAGRLFGSATATPSFFLAITGGDATTTTSLNVDVPVVAADMNGINDMPMIIIDCDGDTDLAVDAAAGVLLSCDVFVSDGDDVRSLSADYSVLLGPGSTAPVSTTGTPPFSTSVRLTTDAGDSGMTTTVRVQVDDAPHSVVADLVVTLL